jgi:hypothetical protein
MNVDAQLLGRRLPHTLPALDMVIDQVIRPRMTSLAGIVAALTGRPPDDARVMSCAFSVHAQCVALTGHRIAERVNAAFATTPDHVEETVDHLTRFLLASIATVGRPGRPRR